MTRRPHLFSIALPLGKVTIEAEVEIERLNPLKTRTLITEFVVLFDGVPLEEANEKQGWQLNAETLWGFERTAEAMLREKIEDEAVRLDEGR